MANQVQIVHIYPGTGGSAGLYMEEIYSALDVEFKQACLVNYYFPFKFGKKLFYKHTEMVGKNVFSKFPLFRLYVRFLELIFAYMRAFGLIKWKYKPEVINFSMTTNLRLELWFLKLLRKYTKAKIVLTCHDVVPFKTTYSNFEDDLAFRKAFFDTADYLLVHNPNSRKDLRQYYDMDEHKIVAHDFPVMDLAKLPGGEDYAQVSVVSSDEIKFSFVGHMRKEKGINVLLDAWKKNQKEHISLDIVGNCPTTIKIDSSKYKNLYFSDAFLSDDDYMKQIAKSDFIILPYMSGTNSGIPSSVASLGSIPITSDIDMFLNNSLVDKELMFSNGNSDALFELIERVGELTREEISGIKKEQKSRLASYKVRFSEQVIATYKHLLFK
ncbi:hypothetical protein K6U59_00195 [Vibrio vulnificus]|uniref:glycosyltransferase n=1 Tax=Vibrio vulnificus TaxID=672 RepID=UPI001EECE1E9|nr:glycosyltransferase [Vibrio vulnificus]MCG6275306.1 hypothetical protein [Vibrio vulnificus]